MTAYSSEREATRFFGKQIARVYIRRVRELRAARNLDVIKANQSMRFHELTGDRKGQFSVKLTKNYRLIVTLENDQQDIVIEGVEDYHGD